MRRLSRRNPPMTREERAALIEVLVREVETYRQQLIADEEAENEGIELSGFEEPSDFYYWDEDELQHRLGVPMLGYGVTRVAVELPDGSVAKLPWGRGGRTATANEIAVWQGAPARLREMLLPPLDYLPDLGVVVFPKVRVLDPYEDAALQKGLEERLRRLPATFPRFTDLRPENSGVYTDPTTGKQRVVLIDYPE